jgi:hypothetical protein
LLQINQLNENMKDVTTPLAPANTSSSVSSYSKSRSAAEIAEAYLHFHTQEKSSQAVDDKYKDKECLALIAPVPTDLLGKDAEKAHSLISHLAQYSLFTVSNQESETPEQPVQHSPPQLQTQLLWNAANRSSQELVSSPLLFQQQEEPTITNLPLIKASVQSSLDDSGGMHREFHHAIHMQVDRGIRHWKATFYMALYILQTSLSMWMMLWAQSSVTMPRFVMRN